MKTRFLRQTTDDKLILQALLYESDQKTDKLVLFVHGMSGNMYERKTDAMAKTLTKNGWTFMAINTRGHDFIVDISLDKDKEESKKYGQTFEKFEDCIKDIKAFLDFAEKEGFREIVLLGHSLGCSKVAYYYYKTHDKRIKKIIFASHADMVGFGEMWDKDGKWREWAKEKIKEGKGKEIIPALYEDWSYTSAATLIDFGTRGNPIDVFNTYDPKASSRALESINIPVLAFMGTDHDSWIDKVGDPRESLKIVQYKTKNAPVFDTAIVEGSTHNYFGYEQEVADLILSWINK